MTMVMVFAFTTLLLRRVARFTGLNWAARACCGTLPQ
jgi:hypothetical protein